MRLPAAFACGGGCCRARNAIEPERGKGRKMSRRNQPGKRPATVIGAAVLSSLLALALLVGLAILAPSVGRATPVGSTTVTCTGVSATDQNNLQTALNAAPTDGTPDTITVSPNCTIDLTSALTVNAGVNITLNGNGLTLVGANSSTDVIDLANSSIS